MVNMHLKESLQDAYDVVRKTAWMQQRQKGLYDKRAHGKPYKIGDYVCLHSPVVPRGGSRKLHRPLTGPFKVITKLSDGTYRIQNLEKK